MHMTLQQESETQVSIVFHGCTWLFRDSFEAFGVKHLTYEQEGTTQYARVMETMDVVKEIGKIEEVLSGVLKFLACRVHGAGAVSGLVKTFVEALRASHEHLHFC